MKASRSASSLALLLSSICLSSALSLTNNGTILSWQETVSPVYSSINDALQSQRFQDVITSLSNINPIAKPSSPEEFNERLQEANATNPANLYHYIANLRALNLIDTIDSLVQYAQDAADGEHSSRNGNAPSIENVYSKKLSCDSAYTVDESALRAAIYIPPTFTWGEKPPVILFPGTGGSGFTVFRGNFIPLLRDSDFADPVWVNVPSLLLNDAQVNAEYAAYAINYISAMTKQNVTVIGWSQGNINVQWAFKYWPSTRYVTDSHVAISPDYAGTVLANFITPPGLPMPASVLQQRYLGSSTFITTLRDDDGDSAYVPTTTIYSSLFDEIVEPQHGTDASGYLLDARNVGVTNNEVQEVCAGQLGGSFYTHEGMLYNPLAFALFKDAMMNGGPGQTSRLDIDTVCSQYLTPGLNVGDLLTTENAIAIAGLGILLHDKMPQEPPKMRYAQSPPVKNLAVCQGSGMAASSSSSSNNSYTQSTTSKSASTLSPTLGSATSTISGTTSSTQVTAVTSSAGSPSMTPQSSIEYISTAPAMTIATTAQTETDLPTYSTQLQPSSRTTSFATYPDSSVPPNYSHVIA